MLVGYSLLSCSHAACTKPAVAVQTSLVHVLLDCLSCIATFCTLILLQFQLSLSAELIQRGCLDVLLRCALEVAEKH